MDFDDCSTILTQRNTLLSNTDGCDSMAGREIGLQKGPDRQWNISGRTYCIRWFDFDFV